MRRGARFAVLLVWGQACLPVFAPAERGNAPPTLELSSPRPEQGGIVVAALQSGVPLSRVRLFDGDRELAMEADADGVFRALLGVDFESAVGQRKIRVEAVGEGGEVQRLSKTLVVRSGRFPTQKLKVAPAYVEPPESERERIAEDRAKVARVWAEADTPRRWNTKFRKPVAAAVPGDFGARRVFNGKPRSRHDGVDLAAPQGAEIAAPAPAVVALAESLYFSGGTVILDHGAGLFTTYFHMSAIDVKPGETVVAGQRLGAVGATGRATGPHLHWGARLHRARVNPLDLLKLPSWPISSDRSVRESALSFSKQRD